MIFEEKNRTTSSHRPKSGTFERISPCFPALTGDSGAIRPVSPAADRTSAQLSQAYRG